MISGSAGHASSLWITCPALRERDLAGFQKMKRLRSMNFSDW
jgi:hypothetical protein